ncbi:MAG TPA: ATP-binding protein [Methylomirabilota bacterium]|nr:ATP-binding protein [Methylomirabilota bacterium]
MYQRRTIDRAVAKIAAAAERCRRVIKNFLALARQRPPERGPVILRQVIDEAVELLAYELRTDNVTVAVKAAPSLPVLSADAHQLHQVLVNLLANAYHGMRQQPGPRALTITTRHDPERARVHVDIADTGPGIPAEIRERIFERFFTTKPAGQGTGLGLSLCRGIVAEHGGELTVESEVGRGSTFTLSLPVAARPAPAGEARAAPAPPPIASRRILVVDDERDLAEVVAEELQRDGHRVETAANGTDALGRLAREPFDLVISDTKMPVMDGLVFFHEIGRRFPALRQREIFITGDALDADKIRALELTGAPYLSKPFDPGAVRNLVRRSLAAAK